MAYLFSCSQCTKSATELGTWTWNTSCIAPTRMLGKGDHQMPSSQAIAPSSSTENASTDTSDPKVSAITVNMPSFELGSCPIGTSAGSPSTGLTVLSIESTA